MNKPILEVCAGSLASALAAQEGGVFRVELCDNLYEGETTPSIGTIEIARMKLSIKLHVIIRPRGMSVSQWTSYAPTYAEVQ
ncbi:MAG: hypothetical protein D4R64_17410 [Porphyromonadaceae bacterium]|nr:MAG: hypothetical protein D4R64_17410 [Porphyromonadaceae bacterium]